ncbi:MAG TPA: hypothetical protein VM686_25580 [Polyangiaceae bacterium]|nr:hypothetical protein [Polyangiaceae bacterium]
MTSAGLHAIVFSCERFESRRGPGAAADVQLDGSRAFDLPGPEVLSGRQILERIAALRKRRLAFRSRGNGWDDWNSSSWTGWGRRPLAR